MTLYITYEYEYTCEYIIIYKINPKKVMQEAASVKIFKSKDLAQYEVLLNLHL